MICAPLELPVSWLGTHPCNQPGLPFIWETPDQGEKGVRFRPPFHLGGTLALPTDDGDHGSVRHAPEGRSRRLDAVQLESSEMGAVLSRTFREVVVHLLSRGRNRERSCPAPPPRESPELMQDWVRVEIRPLLPQRSTDSLQNAGCGRERFISKNSFHQIPFFLKALGCRDFLSARYFCQRSSARFSSISA